MNILSKQMTPQRRALFGLSLGHFSVDLYAALLVPLYPLITTNLGINLASISFIIALGHLLSSVMQPIFGFVSDKLKNRIFMVWGLVLSSCCIPFAIMPRIVFIFIILLLLGMVGNACFHPQVSALVKDFNRNNPNLSSAMGIFLGLGSIGYALGPYISTSIVHNFGQNALLYMIIPGVLCSIFIYFVVPKMPPKDCYIQENFFFIMKEILKNKVCMYLMIVSIVKSAVSISFGTYIPFLLEKSGFSLTQTGIIVTLFFISGGVGTILSSKIEKYINANGVIVLSFLTILPLILLFLYTLEKNKNLAVILFILTGFFILLSVGIILVYAQKAMPKYTGVISGVMQGFSWGLGALFLAPMGLVGQHFGVEKVLILMATIAFLIGLYTIKHKCLKNV